MTFAKKIKHQFAVFYTDIIRVNEKETNKKKSLLSKGQNCICLAKERKSISVNKRRLDF